MRWEANLESGGGRIGGNMLENFFFKFTQLSTGLVSVTLQGICLINHENCDIGVYMM